MKNLTSLVLALLGYASVFCQKVGIGTSSPGATLELYDGNSTGITNLFLARSNYNGLNPVDTVFTIYNNGNVRIGRSWPSPSGLVDIFGKMGDSVLLNLHGSPTMIFSSNAVLRFSANPGNYYFDLTAQFPENIADRSLSIGKLSINRQGSLIIGGGPGLGNYSNSLTINHNASNETGTALVLTEYADANPVKVSFYSNPFIGVRGWHMTAYGGETPDNSYFSFTNFPGNKSILFGGNGKLGVNTLQIASSAQVQINGMNNPNTTPLLLIGVQEYAGNTEALAAGLPAGAVYRTGDVLKIVH